MGLFETPQYHFDRDLQVWVVLHSKYKGWDILRQYNPMTANPMMSYYGVLRKPGISKKYGDEEKFYTVATVHAKNLSGVKTEITHAVEGVCI